MSLHFKMSFNQSGAITTVKINCDGSPTLNLALVVIFYILLFIHAAVILPFVSSTLCSPSFSFYLKFGIYELYL